MSWRLFNGQVSGRLTKAFHSLNLQDVSVILYRRGFSPTDFGGVDSVFTHPFTAGVLRDEERARLCPTLLQSRVTKEADLRLPLPGDQQIGALIRTDECALDWRRPGITRRYELYTVSEDLLSGCRLLLEKHGIHFSLRCRPAPVFRHRESLPTGCRAAVSDVGDPRSSQREAPEQPARGLAVAKGIAPAYGRLVSPIRYRSTSRAAARPSLIAHTTRLWPRRMSPAAKTPLTLVMYRPRSAFTLDRSSRWMRS